MTKKNNMPTKIAGSKVQPAKAKSSKVVAKTAKALPKPQAKSGAKTGTAKTGTAKTGVAKEPSAAKAAVSTKSATSSKSVATKKDAKPEAKGATSPAVALTGAVKPVTKAAAATKAGPAEKGALRQAPPRAPAAPVQRAMPAVGKSSSASKLTAPVVVKPAGVKPAMAAAPGKSVAAPADPAAPKKSVTARHGFKTNELIVYPAHGVGRIVGIEEQEIAGISLELFVIEFEKDKMTLRVPTSKLSSVGMRKLAEDGIVTKSLETLKGRARIKRTMWSRRAQEYEAKINSGDLVAIAEVVRDLYRSEAQPEQSYSERQLYEAALDRMARELAAVDRSDERGAMQRITEILSKSARGRRAAEEASAVEAAGDGEVKAA